MTLYHYADLAINSSIHLGEVLPQANNGSMEGPAAEISLMDAQPREPDVTQWLHHWTTEEGEQTISLARCGGGYLLRFHGLADYSISRDVRTIEAWPAHRRDLEMTRHLLLDQVLPRTLGHQGRLVLHASAVESDGRAIAFAGETGRGKSTMAASLDAAGWPLLGDDGLVVNLDGEDVIAVATYRGLRLWPSSLSSAAISHAHSPEESLDDSNKRRLGLAETSAPAPVPLAALFILGPHVEGGVEDISMRRLRPPEACIAIIRHAFQLVLGDRICTNRLLTAAAAVAERVPVFDLNFPRDFSYLPAVRSAIEDGRNRWRTSSREPASKGTDE